MHTNRLRYTSQLKSTENSLIALEQRIESLASHPDWQGLAQVENSLDRIEERIGVVQQAWTEWLGSLSSSVEIAQATADGRRKVRALVETLGGLRSKLAGLTPSPPISGGAPARIQQAAVTTRPKVKLENISIPILKKSC